MPGGATSASAIGSERSLEDLAYAVLQQAAARQMRIACAESCTGGLLCSLLTDVEGCGGAFERGFITYSEAAKIGMLDVSPVLLANMGAVSAAVAKAMAQGALTRSDADIAVSITGFAGRARIGEEEGLVHLAVITRGGGARHRECHFGPRGRDENRNLATHAALEMLSEALG